MFKHILIPTDGSPLSESAAYNAVQLAKSGTKLRRRGTLDPRPSTSRELRERGRPAEGR